MPRAKSKATNNADNGKSNSFVGQPRSKKSRLSRVEEYDEDPGRDGSQMYHKLAEVYKKCATNEEGKSKSYLKEFKRHVNDASAELKAYARQREQEITLDHKESIMEVLKASRPLIYGQGGQPLCKENHRLFKAARENTEFYQSLLKHLECVEEQVRSEKPDIPVAKWKQDKEDIKEVFTYTGEYGETLIGGLLVPESAVSLAIDQSNATEKDRHVKDMFKESQEVINNDTWGQVAEEQLKQFSIMAKTARLEVNEE
ncbi:hypothetical protein F4808DRAFT_236734 [Astrocystis sublimbata]|nr:hypothetical protein F4808DRAFT_236734 [Astrocystis sublimbata]